MARPVDFQLVRDGERDLTFNGFVLAEAERVGEATPIHRNRAAIYQTLGGRIVVELSRRLGPVQNRGEPGPPAARTGKAAVVASIPDALAWFQPGPLIDELRRKLNPDEPEFIE